MSVNASCYQDRVAATMSPWTAIGSAFRGLLRVGLLFLNGEDTPFAIRQQ
jgi:hypothetical protein